MVDRRLHVSTCPKSNQLVIKVYKDNGEDPLLDIVLNKNNTKLLLQQAIVSSGINLAELTNTWLKANGKENKIMMDFTLYDIACEADDSYQDNLVRQFGKRVDRFQVEYHEYDDATKAAYHHKVASDNAWLAHVERSRREII